MIGPLSRDVDEGGNILNLLSGDFSLRSEADSMAAECGAEVGDGGVSSDPVVLSLNYENQIKSRMDTRTYPDDDSSRFIASANLEI
jgi:hypothetical protein